MHWFSLAEGTGRLWITLAACVLATLVNPKGVALWVYVVTEILHGTNRQFIAEWGPLLASGDVWSLSAHVSIAIALFVLGGLAHVRLKVVGGAAPAFWMLSALPLIAMAFLSVRHVPLAAIWSAPTLTLLAGALKTRAGDPVWFRRLWATFTAEALAATFLMFGLVYLRPRPAISAEPPVFGAGRPCASVEFLRMHQVQGHLYNALWWGPYISWELYPNVLVAMDGRNISLFPREMVLENLRFYARDLASADLGAPFRYDTDFLLVPSDLPVLAKVREDSRWKELHRSPNSVLFLRTDRANRYAALVQATTGGTAITASEACPAFLE
jgi:hypothetical protein